VYRKPGVLFSAIVALSLVASCGGSVGGGGDGGTGDASSSSAGSGSGSGSSSSDGNQGLPASCGASGEPCCNGTACNAGLTCNAAVCSGSSSGSSGGTVSSGGSGLDSGSGAGAACGAAGESCCGTSCNAGDVCVAIGGLSQCEVCGQPGQPCCTTVPACADAMGGCFGTGGAGGSLEYCQSNGAGVLGQPGARCTTTCADPTYTCIFNGMTSYCIACGGLGNPCCGATCGAGLHCTAGTCQ
jgi:hypothetical protein